MLTTIPTILSSLLRLCFPTVVQLDNAFPYSFSVLYPQVMIILSVTTSLVNLQYITSHFNQPSGSFSQKISVAPPSYSCLLFTANLSKFDVGLIDIEAHSHSAKGSRRNAPPTSPPKWRDVWDSSRFILQCHRLPCESLVCCLGGTLPFPSSWPSLGYTGTNSPVFSQISGFG